MYETTAGIVSMPPTAPMTSDSVIVAATSKQSGLRAKPERVRRPVACFGERADVFTRATEHDAAVADRGETSIQPDPERTVRRLVQRSDFVTRQAIRRPEPVGEATVVEPMQSTAPRSDPQRAIVCLQNRDRERLPQPVPDA